MYTLVSSGFACIIINLFIQGKGGFGFVSYSRVYSQCYKSYPGRRRRKGKEGDLKGSHLGWIETLSFLEVKKDLERRSQGLAGNPPPLQGQTIQARPQADK